MLKSTLIPNGTSANSSPHTRLPNMTEDPNKSFEKASGEKQESLGREILEMLRHNKKWWMVPIIAVLLLFGLLLILGSTTAAPFIYTLF